MIFIEQKNQRNCGQIAVAALTYAPLEKVQKIIGHKHSTSTKALVHALRALGYTCPNKVQKWSTVTWWRAQGIAQVRKAGRRGWHWVAIGLGENGHVQAFDGQRSGPMDLADYIHYMDRACGYKITSFLPVVKLKDSKQGSAPDTNHPE